MSCKKTIKALVVEDDPMFQTILENFLYGMDSDIHLDFVSTGLDALSLIKSRKYDFIISDYFLEGNMTGLHLWESCTKRNVNAVLFIMSGMKEEEYRKIVGIDAGPVFLHKPFKAKEFLALFSEYIDNPSERRAA